MAGVPHVTARVAVKELQAEGLLRARRSVVWCPSTHACFPGPWRQAGVSLTWLTEAPPCPRGIRRFFATVRSSVCDDMEWFSEFYRKGCGAT